MKRCTLVLMTLILLIATLAEAQTTRPMWTRSARWDFSLQTRYTASETFTADDGSSLDFDDDMGWGFGFAYNFNQSFNLGCFFSWRSVGYVATAVDAIDPSNTSSISSQMDSSTFGLSGEWNILPGRFTPYANGTLSWMTVDTNISAGWGSGCWWYPYWGYICGPVPLTYGDTTGAYSLGLGGRFEMTEGFYLRLGYEYGWTGIDGMDGTSMIRFDLGLML